jgi:hypothetical protein
VLTDAAHDLGTAVIVILAGLVGAAFLIPGQIQVSSPPGRPRPAPGPGAAPGAAIQLSVFNEAATYAWSLTQALAAWNASGARIHFDSVDTPSADVTVTIANPSPCGSDPDVAARTELGYSGPRTIWIVQRLDKYAEAEVLVHELGHIIGLGHDTSGACATMTPSLWQNCDPPPPGEWRCQLLAASDIEHAVQIIGGTPRPANGPVFCRTGAAS